jgi:hypothetical protein
VATVREGSTMLTSDRLVYSGESLRSLELIESVA